jgi:hypothetical protein
MKTNAVSAGGSSLVLRILTTTITLGRSVDFFVTRVTLVWVSFKTAQKYSKRLLNI